MGYAAPCHYPGESGASASAGPGALSSTFGVVRYPTTFFIDAQGIIQQVAQGPLTRTALETNLRKILIPTQS